MFNDLYQHSLAWEHLLLCNVTILDLLRVQIALPVVQTWMWCSVEHERVECVELSRSTAGPQDSSSPTSSLHPPCAGKASPQYMDARERERKRADREKRRKQSHSKKIRQAATVIELGGSGGRQGGGVEVNK